MPRKVSDAETIYKFILGYVFKMHFAPGKTEVDFRREELISAAQALKLPVPKNLGDVIYSFRYRGAIPDEVKANQPKGKSWVILGTGKGTYKFVLWPVSNFRPQAGRETIKIPDATPEIITERATSDEQGMLAKIRYNRLIDLFLGVTAYSLQSHLRSTDENGSQIEIDEVYLGVDKRGRQYIIPVQAKGDNDDLSVVQTYQDICWCAKSRNELICRPVSVQFLDESKIAMFELGMTRAGIVIKDECHFELVPLADIAPEELAAYNSRPE